MPNVGLSGRLYAKASGVTNEVANLVADFRGGISAEISQEFAEWFGQYPTRQDAVRTKLDFPITISEVSFDPDNLSVIYGASKNASDNLKSVGTEAATSYTFDATTTLPQLEWLVECQLGGKTFQIFCKDALVRGASINLSNMDYNVYDVVLMPIEADTELVKFLLEN